ncbi:MAG: sigma-54 factor interaction domain-containing protein [Deltaproteobacteria bacterium]|nr:sigma-54 factor interaction domain-containing protein [Deltaproteobacteria bacterium]
MFLDEIGEISAAMQAKLLRVLEDKEVCMVGDTRFRKVDIRILAATNKDLAVLVKSGGFREDL